MLFVLIILGLVFVVAGAGSAYTGVTTFFTTEGLAARFGMAELTGGLTLISLGMMMFALVFLIEDVKEIKAHLGLK